MKYDEGSAGMTPAMYVTRAAKRARARLILGIIGGCLALAILLFFTFYPSSSGRDYFFLLLMAGCTAASIYLVVRSADELRRNRSGG